MIFVRKRPAELVIRHNRPQTGQSRPRRKVLHLPAPSDVAYNNVKFAVRTESEDPTVMISGRILRRVALAWRIGSSVVLKDAQFDKTAVPNQRRAVPDKPIHAISPQRHLQNVTCVR